MDRTGAKVCATKSLRNFSQRMHLIHPHCTLNKCFGVFCTIWMYLEPFGCLTKLSAKRAELVQKFVPWSRVRIFHNEPLNPPHWTLTSCFRAFCTTWVHLGQFGSVTTLSTKWAKFLATNARDPPHWTLNSYFGVFFSIWMHLGPFGCLTKLSAKRAELVQKIVPRSRVIIFRNEHTRLTPLAPKLMFWCVSYYLVAFGTD